MPTDSERLSDTGPAAARLGGNVRLAVDGADAPLVPADPMEIPAALAVARRDDAVAGRFGAWTGRVRIRLGRSWRALRKQVQRYRLRIDLSSMSDRELMDIGVSRGEIDCIAARRTVDRLRDGTKYPWMQP
jgi:uncharacterized protein YjiS (DUF1127 family)